jgi:DNA-binding response OmpR family regulator
MKSTILILDDDAGTRKFLETLFASEFQIHSYSCANQDPITLANKYQPSIILVDSFDFCKKLKSNGSTQSIPVMVLSSRNKPSDISEGLTLGADDFLTKPFDHKELQFRIRSHLKSAKAVHNIQFVKVGMLEIDTMDRSAKYAGNPMNLTITEYDILRLLASRVGSVVSREEIMKAIWKDEATDTTDRTIDVHIRSLRKKIPELAEHIRSVYGVGYQYWE